jgi:hypothetical protein
MAADVEEDWGRRVDHWISPPSVVSHSVSAGLFSFAGSFGRPRRFLLRALARRTDGQRDGSRWFVSDRACRVDTRGQ